MATAVCAPARPSADDCLAHPLDVVMASFAATQGQGPWEAELEAGMRGMFSSAEALARIPSLNATPVEQLRPGTLVRYRCMVQDVQDPEFYMALFQQTNVHTGEKILMTGKYRDAMPPQSEPAPVADGEDEGKNVQQRVPLYCVPVPGETKWAADVCTKASAAAVAATAEPAKPRAKRGMSDEAEPVVQPSPPRQRPATGAAPEAASEPQPMDQDATAAPPAPSAPSATGICPPCKPALPQREANFPIAETDGTPCLVKVYGEAGEQIRVHQTLEFVGVLSVAPQLAGFGREEEFTDGIEQTVPYSELPRLHALFHRPVDLVTEAVVLQNAPLAAAAGGLSFPIEQARAALAPQLPALRESFITVATAALGGDRLTAEYLLLHCISRIYHRVGGMCIGQFGLNISGVQPATPPLLSPAPLLAGLLHELLPSVHLFKLSVGALNNTVLIPRKDYVQNRLVAGMLQLPAGTELLVDETQMDEGQLTERGVANLQAIAQLIKEGQLGLDFEYTPGISLEMEIPVLTISTTKSLLPLGSGGCTIPHAPLGPSQAIGACAALQPPAVDGLRAYLALVRTLAGCASPTDGAEAPPHSFDMPPEAERHAQEDFVRCRKTDRSLQAEDMHRWLTMARLLALSYGETKLTEARWAQMKSFETQRKARIPPAPEGSAAGAAAPTLSEQLTALQQKDEPESGLG